MLLILILILIFTPRRDTPIPEEDPERSIFEVIQDGISKEDAGKVPLEEDYSTVFKITSTNPKEGATVLAEDVTQIALTFDMDPTDAIKKDIEVAIQFADESPLPDPSELFDDVYAP